jgi:DNA-directed RNA polymerase subunit H (RpoH/RPB5)
MAKTTDKQPLNIMGHKLVPIHTIISEEERNDLFKRYDITPDQLPKILDTDPVSISVGAKPGQIVKIVRNSHTAREAVAYRFVVSSV